MPPRLRARARGEALRYLGALLAGGASTRFGSDKALAIWRGRSLIEQTLDALRERTDDLVICGRAWPRVHMLNDRPHAGIGPLGGLSVALHHARETGHDWVLCAPLDVVPLVANLTHLKEWDAATVIAEQRAVGLWPVSLADSLDTYLASGQRSIRSWIESSGALEIPEIEPMFNINRPSDLDALRREG